MIDLESKIALWDSFCNEHGVLAKGVPLFKCDELRVDVIPYGLNRRFALKRSDEMEALVISEVEKVLKDFIDGSNLYEGLIYIMFWSEGDRVVPLYIGKSEKYGRKSRSLSQNIRSIRANGSKFCRWGYNYAYHIGDLSAVVCQGHSKDSVTHKYQKWATRLFKVFPATSPELKRQTFFWISAWKSGSTGPWKDVGATSLTFLEYLLIGLASDTFPEILLNEEGVNRA